MPDPIPSDPDCIFCKIISGHIPAHKIFENNQILAFLDVGPLSAGHTLVIPKGHWVTLDQVPDEVSAAIGRILPRLSRSVTKAVGASSWNLLQNNGRPAHQFVDHVHFHIIPKIDSAGLGIEWCPIQMDNGLAEQLRQRMAEGLEA